MREQGCFRETHTNRDRPDENHYRDVRPVPRRLGVRARVNHRLGTCSYSPFPNFPYRRPVMPSMIPGNFQISLVLDRRAGLYARPPPTGPGLAVAGFTPPPRPCRRDPRVVGVPVATRAATAAKGTAATPASPATNRSRNSWSAVRSSPPTTVFRAPLSVCRLNAMSQHTGSACRYAPRPFFRPVRSTSTGPATVLTTRTNSRLPAVSRQATQVRSGTRRVRTPVEGRDRGRVPETRDDDFPEAGGCPPSTGTLATGSSTGTPVMVPPFHA